MRVMRIKEVQQRTGYCRAWIYHLVKNADFPKPIKLGPRASGFIESEVDGWIATRPRGLSGPPEKALAAAAVARSSKKAA